MKSIITFCLLFIAINVSCQVKKSGNKFAAIVNQYVKTKNFSGSVLVADKGKIIYQQYVGLADRQNNLPVTAHSKFKICSITKTFTAVIILQLMEEGKIDLNKTIGTYFPGYTGEARDKVTIHHLLTYSSGIENVDQSSEAMYAMQMPVDTIIRKYCSGKLVTEPGKKMDYKNAEYIILGKIIEKITGKPYAVVLQERILQPLKMTNSGLLHNKDIVPGLADTYLVDSTGKFYNDDPYWIENFYSSGAMYSTTKDLLKFDQALFNNKLLKQGTMKLMTTSYPELWGVAYSFWVNDQKFGTTKTRVMDRRGNIGGANTAWYHFITENITIIVFSNSNAADVIELREKIALALFN
ncbi:serine hydrolase domain-containing protein [Ferruginibacter sp. SUN106]|uniref:serine hydrolase domain-containing protein n=1 Tax=Ferruginibacter sp. SUN106 TaxID=2978348 RepID=UPI003D36F4DE